MSKAIYLLVLTFLGTCGGVLWAAEDQTSIDKSEFDLFNPTPTQYLREMTTDSVRATQSPYTVDAGHFQLEMTLFGYSSYEDHSQGVTYKLDWWNIGPINLRAGLFDRFEVQLILEPYNHVSEREVGFSEVTRRGFGDTTLRLKFNCWGNDSGQTALALMPFGVFPTSDQGLGNDNFEGGFLVPFSVALPWKFFLGLSGSIALTRSNAEQYNHKEFTGGVALSRQLFADFEGYLECFNAATTQKGIGRATTFNLGLVYWLSDNLQLNAGVDLGLTTWADDWYAFLGTSWRF
jgi:Putative MetA-pathway of phenol degradation